MDKLEIAIEEYILNRIVYARDKAFARKVAIEVGHCDFFKHKGMYVVRSKYAFIAPIPEDAIILDYNL